VEIRKNFQGVTTAFLQIFPDTTASSRQAINQLGKKFDQTGSVDDAQRSGRPSTARAEVSRQLVFERFVEISTMCIMRA
jgi:hypothetical protein